MIKLSVYLVTQDEEKRLPKTMQALVNVADEIVVVDSGSTDNTVEIAKSYGAKTYYREWDNYSAQKKYAESLCTGDWLMNIDADEVISPELCSEILDVIKNDKYDICRLRVCDVYPGIKKPNRWVKHYQIVRLYKKGAACMGDTYTWDRVSITDKNARIGLLNGLVTHYSFISMHQIVNKYNKYTDEQVEAALILGKHYSPYRMLGTVILNIVKHFILHREFLYGWWGFINAVNIGYARFMKFAKYYEAQELKKHQYL